MLQLAIIRKVKDGRFSLLLESEIGDFEREIASRVRRILGPKKSYTGSEVFSAIEKAFETYKKDFKEQTIRLK